jgi:hypothetical protein
MLDIADAPTDQFRTTIEEHYAELLEKLERENLELKRQINHLKARGKSPKQKCCIPEHRKTIKRLNELYQVRDAQLQLALALIRELKQRVRVVEAPIPL